MKAKSILIADDDRTLRKALAFELTDLGYVVTEASDGSEAIGLIRNRSFDLVICDLLMPKATGLEVFETASRIRPRAKFISISGFAESAEASFAKRIFRKNFLEKPFAFEVLRAKVERLLHK